MKYLLIIILLFPMFIQAQNKVLPPWIEGNIPNWKEGKLPKNTIGTDYKVIFLKLSHNNDIESQGDEALKFYLIQKKGIKMHSSDIITKKSRFEINDDAKNYNQVRNHTKTIISEGKTVASFVLVDKHIDSKYNQYYVAYLYLVSDEGQPLTNVPHLDYKLDRGAWRSIIVPGWGQMYQKRYGVGIMFLAGEAVALAGAFYCHNRVSYHNKRMAEATDVDTRVWYKKKADDYTNYRNITLGVAAAWYVYNVVDAFTSKKGRLKYRSKTGREYSFAPTFQMNPYDKELALGVSIRF